MRKFDQTFWLQKMLEKPHHTFVDFCRLKGRIRKPNNRILVWVWYSCKTVQNDAAPSRWQQMCPNLLISCKTWDNAIPYLENSSTLSWKVLETGTVQVTHTSCALIWHRSIVAVKIGRRVSHALFNRKFLWKSCVGNNFRFQTVVKRFNIRHTGC